jgi:hypothetical protein
MKLTKQQKRDLKRNKVNSDTSDHTESSLPRSVNQCNRMSVYKRETCYPAPVKGLTFPKNRFLNPKDKYYHQIMENSYKGFVVESPDAFGSDFHESFLHAFEGLDSQMIFQYDITQPAGLGTKTAKTFVTRCLVGITYKYLGLRMFSIPWEEGSIGSTHDSVRIGHLNKQLCSHTERLLQSSGKAVTGSCSYNLTLINR